QRERDVDEPHQHRLRPPAVEPREQADQAADGTGQRDPDHRDGQRDARSVDQSAQHVSSVAIGAEQVAGLPAFHADGRDQALAEGTLDRRARREQGRADRAGQQRGDDDQRNSRRPAPVAADRRGGQRGGDRGGPAHDEYRIFGFRYAYSTSTRRLTPMYIAD